MNAAIIEFENAVGVAAMRNVFITVAHGEALGAFVDQERRDQFLFSAWGFFLARRCKQHGEMRFLAMADEMFDTIDYEIIAILFGKSFHAAQIRSHAGFSHGQAISLFTAHRGQGIALTLLGIACH